MNEIQRTIIAGIICFVLGWTVNGWRYKAAETDALRQDVADAKVADTQSREIVKDHVERQAEAKIIYRTIKKEIPNVTDDRICFANADALSVWNRALEGVSGTAGGTVETSGETGEVTDREILENATENFEQYTEVRDQLNKLIDWHMERRKVAR